MKDQLPKTPVDLTLLDQPASGNKKKLKRTSNLQKTFLQALVDNFGIISVAAKKTGIGKERYYKWLQNDSVFKTLAIEVTERSKEIALDFCESKLFDLVDRMEPSAVYFYLKCKGKQRGYIERQEMHQMGGVKIEFVRSIKEPKLDK